MSIHAVIVEDEPLARRRLERLLSEHEDVEVSGTAENGNEALPLILQERPDVVFLDVQMPGIDGLELLRKLRDKLPEGVRPLIVFTTAHEEHAVEAFALEGTDYLVKPIESEQLERALRRVRAGTWRRDAAGDRASDPDDEAPAREPGSGHLAGHRAGKIVNLVTEDIGCILLEDTITWAYTPQGRYRLKLSLQEAEERLESPPFIRVSRSAIVNLEWIEHLAPMFSGTYAATLRPAIGKEIHVSRRRARKLRQLMGW